MTLISADARAVVEAAHLCFAATVTADGRPNLSPKGTIRVHDDHTLFFLDIASPNTRANLSVSPWIVINVVEQLSRRGYRFAGRGTLLRSGDIFDQATKRVFDEDAVTYPVDCVVLVDVESCTPLTSPGYLHVTDEATMRDLWRRRRAELDDHFEAHLASRGR